MVACHATGEHETFICAPRQKGRRAAGGMGRWGWGLALMMVGAVTGGGVGVTGDQPDVHWHRHRWEVCIRYPGDKQPSKSVAPQTAKPSLRLFLHKQPDLLYVSFSTNSLTFSTSLSPQTAWPSLRLFLNK